MYKSNIILVTVALISFGLGYYVKDFTEPKVEQKAQPQVTFTVDKKAVRQQKKDKRKNNNRHRDKQKQERIKGEKKLSKSVNNPEEDAQNLLQKRQRQEKKITKKLSNKSWWGKKGKGKNIDLSEENKENFDQRLAESLEISKQLGNDLLKLKQSNKDALAQGNLVAIEKNLLKIEEINSQWLAERRTAISDILSQLSAEQLTALAESGGDVAALNWFDFSLEKGVWNADKAKKKQNRRNKHKNPGQ